MAREKVEVAFQLAIMFTILLAVQPLPVHAAATLIQQNSAGCFDPTCTGTVKVSFPSSVTSGNVILVGVVIVFGTVNSVSDSKGSTFAQAVSATGFGASVYIYVATLSSSGSNTVTVTFSAEPVFFFEAGVYIYEVSGVTTTGAVIGTGSGSGTSMATSSVAFVSGAFLLGIILAVSVAATAPGFTLSPAPSGTLFSHAQYSTSGVSSPTTFPATAAVSIDWVEVGVALNPAAAPPPPPSVPVGGEIVSVNQFLVALPWLALFAVVGVAVVGASVVGQRNARSTHSPPRHS